MRRQPVREWMTGGRLPSGSRYTSAVHHGGRERPIAGTMLTERPFSCPNIQGLYRQTNQPGRCYRLAYRDPNYWVRRVREDRHARESWHDSLEQLESLPTKLGGDVAEAGDIAARMREIVHQPCPHGVTLTQHHDRDRRRGPVDGQQCRG